MIDACERAGVTLGVVFQSRFEPLSQQLKRLVDEGTLGRILWNSANTIWYRGNDYYRSGPWRGTWEHEGGGVLINQAIHAIDLILWVTGMPEVKAEFPSVCCQPEPLITKGSNTSYDTAHPRSRGTIHLGGGRGASVSKLYSPVEHSTLLIMNFGRETGLAGWYTQESS